MQMRPFALALAAVLALACKTSGSSAGESRAEADRTGTSGSATAQADTGTETGATASGTMHGDASGATASGTTGMGQHGDMMKGHASDQMLSGTVSKVSDDEIEIADTSGTTRKLKVVDETLVTIDGQDGKVDQLQEGQQVRASYNQVEGDDVAVRIEAGESSMGSGSTGGTGTYDSGSTGTTGETGAGATSDPDSDAATPGSATPSDQTTGSGETSGTGSTEGTTPAEPAPTEPGTMK